MKNWQLSEMGNVIFYNEKLSEGTKLRDISIPKNSFVHIITLQKFRKYSERLDKLFLYGTGERKFGHNGYTRYLYNGNYWSIIHETAHLTLTITDIIFLKKAQKRTNADTYEKIRDNIWQIAEDNGVYCTLIKGNKLAVLVDTGYGKRDLRGYIEKIFLLHIL